jgi:hypothetical protein
MDGLKANRFFAQIPASDAAHAFNDLFSGFG